VLVTNGDRLRWLTVTVVQTVLVFVVIPLAIYGVIALLTLWPKFAKGARQNRSEQEWNFEPVWWTGNPVGVGHVVPPPPTTSGAVADTESEQAQARAAQGGARGNW
jgi:hypothetical protein